MWNLNRHFTGKLGNEEIVRHVHVSLKYITNKGDPEPGWGWPWDGFCKAKTFKQTYEA